jgi:hypothetical protein
MAIKHSGLDEAESVSRMWRYVYEDDRLLDFAPRRAVIEREHFLSRMMAIGNLEPPHTACRRGVLDSIVRVTTKTSLSRSGSWRSPVPLKIS